MANELTGGNKGVGFGLSSCISGSQGMSMPPIRRPPRKAAPPRPPRKPPLPRDMVVCHERRRRYRREWEMWMEVLGSIFMAGLRG